MIRRKSRKITIYVLILTVVAFLCGCSSKKDEASIEITQANTVSNRSSEPKCLTPVAGKEEILGKDMIELDVTNSAEGYLYVTYSGINDDVKMQIACKDQITYTYRIEMGDTVVPLSGGSGNYHVVVYEGMGNGQYSTMYTGSFDVNLANEFGPFLYPNCYVSFDMDSKAVAKGRELAENCSCDLEVIGKVYEYVTENIEYDYEEANNVSTRYVPDPDEVLTTGKGICFGYASLMAAMLRSQRIPTRLEIGYAGDAYHAWITTYVEDIGWINGIIQFDGMDWTLMDPTFAANADEGTLRDFIGNGDNYTTKYIY